ncbi:MAG: response regulator [Thermodesulfobacteriota bacterium]
MLHLILATIRPEALQAFAAALASNPEVRLEQVDSGAAALLAVSTSTPQLVIIDTDLPDFPSLDLVQKLLMVNALVNTAVVSPLTEPEFHEVSEGLGILYRLPMEPGAGEAADLLQKLRRILGMEG